MKMFWLLFSTFFLSFLQFSNAQSCSTDQQNAIKTCYLTYLKLYGFDVIPEYNKYDDALDKYRVRGWNGELYICNNGKQLISCIGDANDACVTVDVMRNISGLRNPNPAIYVSDYRVMKYRCYGDGFTEFKDTYTCLQQLQDCPGDPINCEQIVPYIKCIEDEAFQLCGAEARDFACNILDIEAKVGYNCDPLPKCSKNQTEIPSFKKFFKHL